MQDQGTALLLMTRDLGIVAHFCQHVAVLMEGKIIEDRPVRASSPILTIPTAPTC